MIIKKLVLYKYKRLQSSHIQYFEYNPKSPMQIIIGRNGSGKSSVLEELTPCPPDKNGFLNDGYKLFECTHDGSYYALKSLYNGGSGHHSFVKDGEELNKGHTLTIQKDLVKEIFGLTREIHELLTGAITFSGLSTAKRREWLTMMTPVDMRYAFSMFKMAASAHRDQLGAIRHLTKRMTNENTDLPDDSELDHLRKQTDALVKRYESVQKLRNRDVQAPYNSKEDIERTLQALVVRSKRLLNHHPSIPSWVKVNSAEGLSELISDYSEKRTRLRTVIARSVEEHDELVKASPSRDMDLTDVQIDQLKAQVTLHQLNVDKLKEHVDGYSGVIPLLLLDGVVNANEFVERTYNEWVDLIAAFPDNSDNKYTREKGDGAKERHREIQTTIGQLKNEQNTKASRLARLKGCAQITCPSCTHQFTPGVDPREVDALNNSLENIGSVITRLEKETADLDDYIEKYDEYLGYVRSFHRLVRESPPQWKPVWDWCLNERVMTTAPKNYMTRIVTWHTAMEKVAELHTVSDSLSLLQHRLRYVEAIDHNALDRNTERRKFLEKEVENLTQELNEIQGRIDELESVRSEVTSFVEDMTDTAARLERFMSDMGTQREYLLQKAVAEESKHVNLQLAQVQNRLSQVELREGLLNDIQQQHDMAVQRHAELGIIAKSLSPTDGLIGRYLMGFMKTVVRLMNAVIADVWTYPMEVMPSKVEKNELDYRFPLNVNNESVIAPDISRGSASQVDIVNFSFKLLVMKFLKLDWYPLFLDELGSTFDEQHRENIIPFITRMLEQGQVNQIFFISHYSSTHGAFNQAEVCVLDPSNITVPFKYNEQVIIQ